MGWWDQAAVRWILMLGQSAPLLLSAPLQLCALSPETWLVTTGTGLNVLLAQGWCCSPRVRAVGLLSCICWWGHCLAVTISSQLPSPSSPCCALTQPARGVKIWEICTQQGQNYLGKIARLLAIFKKIHKKMCLQINASQTSILSSITELVLSQGEQSEAWDTFTHFWYLLEVSEKKGGNEVTSFHLQEPLQLYWKKLLV